ncbi:MAG: type II toxin-antitoxin system VapC family toxin, partial [Gemmatimonadota bacterium]|nr:type II toxin-antitoxin system VapC family toxin [Gemmatimonadota bacterium]
NGTPGSLGTAARTLIDRAAIAGRLFLSDFSFWEVARLVSKGQLQPQADLNLWLDRAESAPGIVTVPVTREVLVQSTRLPGTPHGDPADRILLASAGMLGAALLTCDRGIITYAFRTPGVPVCDARG